MEKGVKIRGKLDEEIVVINSILPEYKYSTQLNTRDFSAVSLQRSNMDNFRPILFQYN